MIILYDQNTDDFSNNGVCVLQPTMCEVEEEAGGMYELRLTHPITSDLRANLIQRGMIIKAPVPAIETPLIQISAEGHEEQAEHEVWKADVATSIYTNTKSAYQTYNSSTFYSAGAKVTYSGRSYQAVTSSVGATPGSSTAWKQISSPNPVLEKIAINTELIYHEAIDTWSRVTSPSGTTGYVKTANISYLRTDPYIPALPSYQTAVPARKIKDQLFRINRAETDSKGKTVYVEAHHIFYDLRANVIKDYNAVNQAPQDVLNAMSIDFCNDHDFTFYTNSTENISAELALKNGVEALLDDENGIVPKIQAQLIRDNLDVFIINNVSVDRGVRIVYGKNMLGIKVTEDQSSIATRIIPAGRALNGSYLKLPEVFIDSPRILDYPIPYAKAIFYDDAQVKEATETEPAVTESEVYDILRAKVAKEFEAKADQPNIDVEVEYIHLGDTVEYAQFRELQRVFLYDTVMAKYGPMGMEFVMQVTGYVYDAILRRFKKTKLSNKLYKKNATEIWSI